MEKQIALVIILMAVVTYIPRMLPLVLLSCRSLLEIVAKSLSFISPAIMAALLAPVLFLGKEGLTVGRENMYLWTGVPTLIAA